MNTTENNPRKIAVLHVCPAGGHVNYAAARGANIAYRYTSFERQVRTGAYDKLNHKPELKLHCKIVLRYDDRSIQEFLDECRYSFGVSRNLAAPCKPFNGIEGQHAAVDLSMNIHGADRVIAHFLGVIDGYHCYAVFKESNIRLREVPYQFSVRSVPDYGMADVVYSADTVRESFGWPNHANSRFDDFDEPSLFNKMDALIEPIMAPMTAFPPPPVKD